MLETLDTIIGMLFVFLTFSLLVSAAQEVIAATLRLRGKTLKKGLDGLLTNLDPNGLADLFWAHPFIKSLQTSAKPPSYIPSTNVAAAVMHMASCKAAGKAVTDVAELKTGLTGFTHKNLATIVATVIEQCGAGATLAQVQAGLEKWADSTMERVSSRYSSDTRLWLFCVALTLGKR